MGNWDIDEKALDAAMKAFNLKTSYRMHCDRSEGGTPSMDHKPQLDRDVIAETIAAYLANRAPKVREAVDELVDTVGDVVRAEHWSDAKRRAAIGDRERAVNELLAIVGAGKARS